VLNNFAIFDTGQGVLQWHGRASISQAALFAHLRDVGYFDEIADYQFRVLELDDAQYASLMAWWRGGQCSPDWLQDMHDGEVLTAGEVIKMMSD